ncbi:hypothetical protein [Dietzia sp. NCCP-2495]|uniref:hypothetical protein n=1 Tax=Dietzia sp. NCCP-2495 TaxID=2934675 RepID=UPI00222E3C60|nr:hypothetical protein [Dietzia sp. NCCP-2495]
MRVDPAISMRPVTSPVLPTTVTGSPLRISSTVYPAVVRFDPEPGMTVHVPSSSPAGASARPVEMVVTEESSPPRAAR